MPQAESKARWTPGTLYGDGEPIDYSAEGVLIYDEEGRWYGVALTEPNEDEGRANARLWAASPDLVEALKRISSATVNSTNSESAKDALDWCGAVADSALAKLEPSHAD